MTATTCNISRAMGMTMTPSLNLGQGCSTRSPRSWPCTHLKAPHVSAAALPSYPKHVLIIFYERCNCKGYLLKGKMF